MQFLDGKLLFSASDLVNLLGCRHATCLDLRNLTDEVVIPERDAATVLWIWTKLVNDEAERDRAEMPFCPLAECASPPAGSGRVRIQVIGLKGLGGRRHGCVAAHERQRSSARQIHTSRDENDADPT
jgi:uncharacterized protein